MEWVIVVCAGLLWVIYAVLKDCLKQLKRIASSSERKEDRIKDCFEQLQFIEQSVHRLELDVNEIRSVSDDFYKIDLKPRKVY